jgi:hypothetical protein
MNVAVLKEQNKGRRIEFYFQKGTSRLERLSGFPDSRPPFSRFQGAKYRHLLLMYEVGRDQNKFIVRISNFWVSLN